MTNDDEDVGRIARRADALVEGHRKLLADLISYRAEHDLTQAVVAERMGVSQPAVAAFERYDANPTLSTIRRYALAVGVRISERVIDDCADTVPSTFVMDTPAAGVRRPAFVDRHVTNWAVGDKRRFNFEVVRG
jgi:transcriptional regulator with XRE-family HTH domain